MGWDGVGGKNTTEAMCLMTLGMGIILSALPFFFLNVFSPLNLRKNNLES